MIFFFLFFKVLGVFNVPVLDTYACANSSSVVPKKRMEVFAQFTRDNVCTDQCDMFGVSNCKVCVCLCVFFPPLFSFFF